MLLLYLLRDNIGIIPISLPNSSPDPKLKASSKHSDLADKSCMFRDTRRKGWARDYRQALKRPTINPAANVSKWDSYQSVMAGRR